MTSLNVDELTRLSAIHPKPTQIHFQYGTAGFRTLYVMLTTALYPLR